MRNRMLSGLLAGLLLTLTGGCNDHDGTQTAGVARQTPAPSSTPTAAASSTPAWRVRRTTRADLDGDQVPEVLSWGSEYGPLRLFTELSTSGMTVSFESSRRGVSWWPEAAADLDDDGADELVVAREWSGTTPVVITLAQRALRQVDRPKRPLLAERPGPGPAPGTAYHLQWWVEGDQLLSSRSLEAFPLSSHQFEIPTRYRAKVWSWSLRGHRLEPTDRGTWCVTATGEAPHPC